MSIFPGGGTPSPPPPRPAPPPPPPPPPPPIPPEPEGKIVDKAKAASDTARRAGRKGSTLNKVSGGGLGTINRPSAGGDNDKLG
jgi:hypothetical protein